MPPRLPSAFTKTFEHLRKLLFWLYIKDWVLLGGALLLLFLLVFIALDRLFFVPSWVRPTLFALGLIGFLIIGPLRFFMKAYSQRSELALTQIIKNARLRLGDRIQGALEIAQNKGSGGSKELQEAALEQIGLEAQELDVKSILPRLPHHIHYSIIAGATFIVLVALALIPNQVSNASKRFFFPLTDIQRYSAIRFEKMPRNHYVVQGQPFEYKVKLKEKSFSEESIMGSGKLDGQPETTVEYDNGFTFSLGAIDEPKTFTLQAGDAYQSVEIIPRQRPRVDSLSIKQKLPSYLRLNDRVLNVDRKQVQVVKGSQVSLDLRSTEKIKSITTKGLFSLESSGSKAWSQELEVSEDIGDEIFITDRYGLTSYPGKSLKINSVEDKAPVVRLIYKQKEITLLPHETVDLKAYAEDDFGVEKISLNLLSLSRTTEVKSDVILMGKPSANKLKSDYALNPEVLKLIPDSYEVYASAQDYYPDREPEMSAPLTLHLLSYEAHASKVKEHFTTLIDTLDEYYQNSLSQHHENQEITKSYVEKPHDYALTHKMKQSINNEKKALTQLNDITTTALDLAQDAFRNNELDRSTQLALTLYSQRLLSDFPPRIDEEILNYEKAADNKFSFQVREAYMKKTLEVEAEMLFELRELIDEMRAFDRKFEASSFVQRLKTLAKSHTNRAQDLLSSYTPTIVSELTPGQKQSNEDIARLQDVDIQTLKWIEKDLMNYSAYAKKAQFEKLANKISESEVYREMRHLNTLILANQRFRSTSEKKRIAEQLMMWAEEISNNTSTGAAGGGGGGGGGASQQEGDVEFMFRIMEIIREQQNLRGKTRALDQQKKSLNQN